jgi:hypothetical protein
MHQKHPPAKIAVLASAARVSSDPKAMRVAARKAAVNAAQIHRAIMGALRRVCWRSHKRVREGGIVALARP